MSSVVALEERNPNFMADWIAALAAMDNPNLDGKANYGTYPTLGGCLAAAKAALAQHNMAVMQLVCPGEDGQPDRLVTRVLHTSGQSMEDGGVPLYCADKNNPQKLGSAITYARRYGLLAMCGVVGDDDDDGNLATPPKQRPQAKPAPVPIKPQPTETRDDYASWTLEQINGFAKHRDLAQHATWATVNKATLEAMKNDAPGERAKLLSAYTKRKEELENA
jgi:hypothetical protein